MGWWFSGNDNVDHDGEDDLDDDNDDDKNKNNNDDDDDWQGVHTGLSHGTKWGKGSGRWWGLELKHIGDVNDVDDHDDDDEDDQVFVHDDHDDHNDSLKLEKLGVVLSSYYRPPLKCVLCVLLVQSSG